MQNSSDANPQAASPQNSSSQESPLDWVKQSIGSKKIALEQAVPGFIRADHHPQMPTPVPPPAQAAPPAPPVSNPPAAPVIETPAQADEFVQALMNESPVPPAPIEPAVSDEKKPTPEQSIKDMRKIINQNKSELEAERTARAKLEADLEKFKTGEAIPDVLREKEEEIDRLKRYESLHGLKLSTEYQKKFVEPFNNSVAQAQSVAKDYGVEEDVVQEALHIDNKRELNAFLRAHFDEVGALEMRKHIDAARAISNQAREAEQKPTESMSQLQQEYRAQQQEREAVRVRTIKGNAQSGWTTALRELMDSGEYPELTPTGDPEHDKIVTEVRTKAASEYGKFVTMLGNSGVADLPPEAAKILAKRFQISQAGAIMAASRAHHHSRSEELIQESRRMAAMTRPQIGGINNGVPAAGGAMTTAKQSTVEDRAGALLDSVLSKRR